jgi:hypothetical protein
MLPYLPGNLAGRDQPNTALIDSFVEDARSFYFDSALSAAPLTLSLLKEFAKPGHVLFGSDYPYAPTPAIKQMNGLLDGYQEKDEAFVTSVNLDAAKQLFPRLASLLD